MFQGVSGRRTDHRKPCSLGIVTFHPRWHTKGEAASSDLRIQKALQQTFFSVLGMEPRALHSGQATTVPHPDLTSSKSFSLWRTRPKRLFYQLLLWFLVVWIFHFYFVWPVGGQSVSAGWWKRHIPANWPFVLKNERRSLFQPWAQCSLSISRQCLWLKIMSTAFEAYCSWHHKKSLAHHLHNAL